MEPSQVRVRALERRPRRGIAADRDELRIEDLGRRLDLCVAEPVERERRLEHDRVLGGEDVLVRRLRGAECPGVQATVGFDHLGVAHHDMVIARSADREPDPARDVLAAIEPPAALTGRRETDRQDGDPADGRRGPLLDEAGIERDSGRGDPARVIEARRIPAGLRHAQVDGAAVVQIRRADLGGRRMPAPVRHDDHACPVDALDLELGNQSELTAVAASVVRRVPTEPPAVPPVPEHGADGVPTRRQEALHVVGVRQDAVAIRRPTRCQEVVGEQATVQRHLVHAACGHVEPRAGDRCRHVELPPEHRRRGLIAAARVVRDRDGASGPCAGLEEARLDAQRVAPARPARDVTHAHPVVANLPAPQRTPWCRYRDLRVAVSLIGRRNNGLEAKRFGGLDLVAELDEPGMGGTDLPREARLLSADREDAVRELRAESLDDERHPLTAPEEIPDTIWRWKNRNTISGGMVIRSTSAKSRCQRVLNWLWKLNSVSWTVAFSVPGRK